MPKKKSGILSPMEIKCLHGYANGKSTQKIGDTLWISRRTVENYLRSVREKLCVHTTVQAVGKAIGLKIIAFDYIEVESDL